MSTKVSGSSGKEFTPAPIGAHQAVCVDVIDKGLMDTPWGQKRKIDIRWQISEDMENGKPFLVTKRYTASLNEKANLRKDLESWRGKAFTEAELEEFDVDVLIGVNCLVNVIHNTDPKGRVWANVQTVTPLVKGMVKMAASPDYVMERNRKAENQSDDTTHDEDEDAVPF